MQTLFNHLQYEKQLIIKRGNSFDVAPIVCLKIVLIVLLFDIKSLFCGDKYLLKFINNSKIK